MNDKERDGYLRLIDDASARGPDSSRSVIVLLAIIAKILLHMAVRR